MDSLYDQISSLGVTPEGKTLAAITSAQQSLYNAAYSKGQTEATLVFGTDVQVWDVSGGQYGAASGAKSFPSNGKIIAITSCAISRQVYDSASAWISVTLGGSTIANSSASISGDDQQGWAHGNSGWKDYTAGTAIGVSSGDGGDGRWKASATVIFVKSN